MSLPLSTPSSGSIHDTRALKLNSTSTGKSRGRTHPIEEKEPKNKNRAAA
ncbi:MAG: hypothetical protein LBD67_04825 [Candidatus Accumulibacter sp.]|nr:hypothetical protein [Accumulibacter sp.]